MTTTSAPVRDRLLTSATLLLRSRGADGFGMSELLAHSGVARRSMYQHFPDGKAELLRVVTADAGKAVTILLKAVLEQTTALDAVDLWAQEWADALTSNDFTLGCPLAASSLTAAEYPEAAEESATAFRRLAELIAGGFERDGLEHAEAVVAGSVLVSGMQGAIITARARRDVEPLVTFAAHARTVWGPRMR